MKELTVANQLCALHSIARFYPGMWTHSADMMSVALMTDPASRSQAQGSVPTLAKGKARYGQMAILVELIQNMKKVRQSRDSGLVRFSSMDVCHLDLTICRIARYRW